MCAYTNLDWIYPIMSIEGKKTELLNSRMFLGIGKGKSTKCKRQTLGFSHTSVPSAEEEMK